MSNQHSDSDSHQHHEIWLFSRNGIATIGMLAILGFLVYTGHSAHLLGVAPYLLILACPLMHIFMHGGHHNHSHNHDDAGTGDDKNDKSSSHSHSHGGGCCGGGDHSDHDQKADKKPSSNPTQGE